MAKQFIGHTVSYLESQLEPHSQTENSGVGVTEMLKSLLYLLYPLCISNRRTKLGNVGILVDETGDVDLLKDAMKGNVAENK